MGLSEKIWSLHSQYCLSQQEIALSFGISTSSVSAYENAAAGLSRFRVKGRASISASEYARCIAIIAMSYDYAPKSARRILNPNETHGVHNDAVIMDTPPSFSKRRFHLLYRVNPALFADPYLSLRRRVYPFVSLTALPTDIILIYTQIQKRYWNHRINLILESN